MDNWAIGLTGHDMRYFVLSHLNVDLEGMILTDHAIERLSLRAGFYRGATLLKALTNDCLLLNEGSRGHCLYMVDERLSLCGTVDDKGVLKVHTVIDKYN